MMIAYDGFENPDYRKPFRLIINSGGGCLDTSLTLYDTIKMMRSPVETLGRYVASGLPYCSPQVVDVTCILTLKLCSLALVVYRGGSFDRRRGIAYSARTNGEIQNRNGRSLSESGVKKAERKFWLTLIGKSGLMPTRQSPMVLPMNNDKGEMSEWLEQR